MMNKFNDECFSKTLGYFGGAIETDDDFEAFARTLGGALLAEAELHHKKNPKLVRDLLALISKEIAIEIGMLICRQNGMNDLADKLQGEKF